MLRAVAPGRVNLMGDHTDHTGGLVLPMAVDLGTTVEGEPGGGAVVLRSTWAGDEATVPLDVPDPAAVLPSWARPVAGVVAELQPPTGFRGTVTTGLPVGAGLASSAALEVATALALGFEGDPADLARRCQAAEQRATGVPCGVMDQLASVAGVDGAALRIDCTTLTVRPVPFPDDLEVVVVHSGEARELAASPYGARVGACRRAEAAVGPLRTADLAEVEQLGDEELRRRARHVVTENRRVDELASALAAGDRTAIADLMAASHASLRDDFEVSTPALDALVEDLVPLPGVVGARLTGAGFGGCVVALVERGAEVRLERQHWRLHPAGGATCDRAGRPSWPGTPRR